MEQQCPPDVLAGQFIELPNATKPELTRRDVHHPKRPDTPDSSQKHPEDIPEQAPSFSEIRKRFESTSFPEPSRPPQNGSESIPEPASFRDPSQKPTEAVTSEIPEKRPEDISKQAPSFSEIKKRFESTSIPEPPRPSQKESESIPEQASFRAPPQKRAEALPSHPPEIPQNRPEAKPVPEPAGCRPPPQKRAEALPSHPLEISQKSPEAKPIPEPAGFRDPPQRCTEAISDPTKLTPEQARVHEVVSRYPDISQKRREAAAVWVPPQHPSVTANPTNLSKHESGVRKGFKRVINKASDKIERHVPGARILVEFTKLAVKDTLGNPTGPPASAVTTAAPAEFPFSDNFPEYKETTKWYFGSTCERVHNRLVLISQHYPKVTIPETELMAAHYQLLSKEVSISVFGQHNCGKSTLLNTLAGGGFLPVSTMSETSFKVKIFHEGRVHRGQCTKESTDAIHAEQTEPSCLCTRSKEGQHVLCPMLREVHAGGTRKVIYGEENIVMHLEELNSNVRKKTQAADTLPEFELYVNAPVLSGVPTGWRVCLVDNPGFGEAKEHVTQLAEKAMKISSAYIYLVTTKTAEGTVDAEAFHNMAEHDKKAFDDGRFIAVITHFDENYETKDRKQVSECEIKERVASSISEATRLGDEPPLCVSEDSVIPISGLWAFNAEILKTMDESNPLYKGRLKDARKALDKYPHLECPVGQGERLKDYLKGNAKIVPGLLMDASGVRNMEKKIKKMTQFCVKIWAERMTSHYSTFLTTTKEKLLSQWAVVTGDKDATLATYDCELELYDSIQTEKTYLELLKKPKTSPVWMGIDAAYPTDIKTARLEVVYTTRIKELVKDFEDQIRQKIKRKDIELTQQMFNDELGAFLKHASSDLDETFNCACAFSGTQDVLSKHRDELMEKAGIVRTKIQKLLNLDPMKQTTQQSAKDGQDLIDSQAFEKPNLGSVKEEVNIPPVSFSIWDQVKIFFRNLFSHRDTTAQDEAQTALDKRQATLHYHRRWTKKHDEMMILLQKSLAEQCKNYLKDIQPKTVQYFFDKYKDVVERELQKLSSFESTLKEKKKSLDKMHAKVEKQQREIFALQGTVEHLAMLENTLQEKSKGFIMSLYI